MILFWGSKGYKKCWEIHKLLSSVAIVTMLVLGKLRNTDASLLFTGFPSFLTVKVTSFLVRFATTVKKLRNLKLKTF